MSYKITHRGAPPALPIEPGFPRCPSIRRSSKRGYYAGVARFQGDPEAFCGSAEEAIEKAKRNGRVPIKAT